MCSGNIFMNMMVMLILYCVVVEMDSFRVTVVCFWNGSIRSTSNNVKYVGGRRKLFACNSYMDLNEFKHFICFRIGIDTTRSTINLSFKYNLSGDLLATQETQNPFMQERWI